MAEQNHNRAQTRENVEPDEANNPIPLPMIMLFIILATWGFGYIFIDLSEYRPLPAAKSSGALTQQDELNTQGEVTISDNVVAEAANVIAPDAKALYAANCAACHQGMGGGLAGVFPPLTGSSWVDGDPAVAVQILLHGVQGDIDVQGITYNGVMPPFKDTFNDQEMAVLVNHIRTSWGNSTEQVIDADFVSAERHRFDRTTPWEGGDELQSVAQAE